MMNTEISSDPATQTKSARDLATLSMCMTLFHLCVLFLLALFFWLAIRNHAFLDSAFAGVLATCIKLGLFFSILTIFTALLSGHMSLRHGSASPRQSRFRLALASLIITYAVLALCLAGCGVYAVLAVAFLGG